MTFLQTIFLPALAAAVIPLALHFLSRFRLPVVQFSSLEFLQRLQKRQSRRLQLRQIILLITRTLATAAIVLVFARPALQSAGAGAAASVEMAVLIDDAIASAVQTRDGALSRLCAENAAALFETMELGDNFTLVPLSQPAKFESASTGQDAIVKESLASLVPRCIPPKTAQAALTADTLLAKSPRTNREIIIISGFYDSYWDTFQWQPIKGTRVFLLPTGPEQLQNLAVDSVVLRSTILRQGQPVELEARLTNNDAKSVEKTLLSVYLAGERIAQASLDVPAKGRASQILTITSNTSGLLAGSLRIDDADAFPVDNRRYFTLFVPEKLNVLAVTTDSLTQSIVRAALTAGTADFVRLESTEAAKWETKSLAEFDVVLLAGVARVSEGAVERLAEFVERGGGLVLFPSLESDLAALGRGLWRRLGFSPATGMLATGGVGWGKIELTHPIFYGMFEPGAAPTPPNTRLAVKLAAGPNDEVVIPMADGNSFLIERQVGSGKALMFAAPLSPQAGDFIFSGIFAPLLFRSLAYAAAREYSPGQNWQTGAEYILILPLDRAHEAVLEGPEGERWILPPQSTPSGMRFEVKEVETPGIYNLRIDDKILARYAANLPPHRLRSTRSDITALAKRLGGAGILPESPQNLSKALAAARYGYELWKTIAAAFIGLLIAESIIARAKKSEK